MRKSLILLFCLVLIVGFLVKAFTPPLWVTVYIVSSIVVDLIYIFDKLNDYFKYNKFTLTFRDVIALIVLTVLGPFCLCSFIFVFLGGKLLSFLDNEKYDKILFTYIKKEKPEDTPTSESVEQGSVS